MPQVILNHNPCGEPWQVGDFQTLERLKLAVEYNQKAFVAHPSVQQLLASIWYEGLPGFRRRHIVRQVIDLMKLACMYPVYSMSYIVAPRSASGRFMKNPFVKFIAHKASYMLFLMLLALASQRFEHLVVSILCMFFPDVGWLVEVKNNWETHERGNLPGIVDLLIAVWVQSLLWIEMKTMWKEGLISYMMNLWNLADMFSYGSFMGWIGLRMLSWLIVQKEQWEGYLPEEIWTPREQWHPFEPQLLAEAMFGAGMISSYLKIVQIFSINPYLGPLQISLGKMVIDIIKWMILYILVVFAFGCGMNQLLWYYSDLEKQDCYSLPGGLPDFEGNPDACATWRRFNNLWETSQSLFWASFGLVDLGDFDLKGIKEFTRFWGLLMFGSYSVCNIIVLLNMLIAMMSNSYQVIFERSDTEWKFSRSKLWISYFNSGSTVPPPFNLIPSPKSISRYLCCKKTVAKESSQEEINEAIDRYKTVMKYIVRRYVTNEQRNADDYTITEDDISEVRQDINSFKYELLDVLRANSMKVPTNKDKFSVMGRKSRNMERQIQKGFQINKIEGILQSIFDDTTAVENKPRDLFKKIAKMVAANDKKDWQEEGKRRSSIRRDPIGSTANSIKRRKSSLHKSLLSRGNSQDEIKVVLTRLNSEELVAFNPLLNDVSPATRKAYALFKSALAERALEEKDEEEAQQKKEITDKSSPEETAKKLEGKLDDKKAEPSSGKVKPVSPKSSEKKTKEGPKSTAPVPAPRSHKAEAKQGASPEGDKGKETTSASEKPAKQSPPPPPKDTPPVSVHTESELKADPKPKADPPKPQTQAQVSEPKPDPAAAPSKAVSPKPAAKEAQEEAAAPCPSPKKPVQDQGKQASVTPAKQPSSTPTPVKAPPKTSPGPAKPEASAPPPKTPTKAAPKAPAPSAKAAAPPKPASAQATPAKSSKAPPAPSPGPARAEEAKKQEEPEWKWDPEGKSAISGQKRTGWI